MNWPSWIWKMPASDSPLLFVVLWIYSYNLFVRGLWALLTVSLHYFVVIYITHWIWFGQGSLQTPQLFACTHRDTPLLFIPHPQIDQIQNDCFSNFTDMGRRECANVMCKSVHSVFVFCVYVSVSFWSKSMVQLGSWSEPEAGSKPLQQCFVPSAGQSWISFTLTERAGVALHGCSSCRRGQGTRPLLKNLLTPLSFEISICWRKNRSHFR